MHSRFALFSSTRAQYAQQRALADWLPWWRRSMICRTINDLSDCLREKNCCVVSLSAGFIYQRDDYNLIPGTFLKCEGGKRLWHRLASSFTSLVYYLTHLICSEPYIGIHVFVQQKLQVKLPTAAILEKYFAYVVIVLINLKDSEL